jgi:rare lipoprotein A
VFRGQASYYGAEFAGLPTASGEIFDPNLLTAAHRTLPLGTLVEVTNERNGKTVRVTINDRGPFKAHRILDLSHAAAKALESTREGVVPVSIRVLVVGDNRRKETTSTTGWAVQAGAFANEQNAMRLRDKLASRYPTPFLEEFQGLKRVKFGPYSKREDAENAAASLEELGLAGIVVPYK